MQAVGAIDVFTPARSFPKPLRRRTFSAFPSSSLSTRGRICGACGLCVARFIPRRTRGQAVRREAARRRKSKASGEEKWLPFLAAGAFGLLALGPTLLLGSIATWWAVAVAATVGGLLYFSVAVPMMITAALVGGIVIPILTANFLVAGSLIATFLASLTTAVCGGLLIWVSLGNPLPFLDSSFGKKELQSETSTALEEVPKEDPFDDWDRRFAKATKEPEKPAEPIAATEDPSPKKRGRKKRGKTEAP